jgi:hypothetical protein
VFVLQHRRRELLLIFAVAAVASINAAAEPISAATAKNFVQGELDEPADSYLQLVQQWTSAQGVRQPRPSAAARRS